jgi:tetratricopeptide (TPR) repeat protein
MAKLKKRAFLWIYFLAGFSAGFSGARFWNPAVFSPGKKTAAISAETRFGDWLAAQHAVFADDFEKAIEFLDGLDGVKSESVAAMRSMVVFLDTADVKNARDLKKLNVSAFRVINAAAMAKDGKWAELYGGFKNERSHTLAPFRIWSAVGSGRLGSAVAFIDGMERANNSWKNFAKGCVYAAAKSPRMAKKFFDRVPMSFMNIGDYHLVMSFYKKHGFDDAAAELRKKWIGSPGGMFMADLDLGEDWGMYDSFRKMLAAGLVQNVSHGGEQGFSDSGLLVLRIAAMVGGESDSVNYYTGGYFYSAGSGNYKRYWDRLKDSRIYGPFVEMKIAEKDARSEGASDEVVRKAARGMEKILQRHPLFIPAMQKLWAMSMQAGRDGSMLRFLDRALGQDDVPDAGRAYLLKLRAHTFYLFGGYDDAEDDLAEASKLAPMDAGIMGLSARVWAARKKNLDEAYRYAISLVKAFPGNVENWDILAMVVFAKEGAAPAREILERIGRVAEECSELFVHIGDFRARDGEKMGAARAYEKAISLSGDGLVIKGEVERKLRKVGG